VVGSSFWLHHSPLEGCHHSKNYAHWASFGIEISGFPSWHLQWMACRRLVSDG